MSAETLRQAARRGAEPLAAAGSDEAAQTARLLLCHVLNFNFTDYVLAREDLLSPRDAARYEELLTRRASGVPLQYLTREQNFCGLSLYVDERVLIPRQDTECLVEEVLRDGARGALLDLCTGSGCIPLALLKHGNFSCALGADISAEALAVAETNRARTGLPLLLRQSDLFSEIPERFDVITANPPYIESAEIESLSVEVRDHEPRLALDGAADGLAFYRRLAAESGAHLKPGGRLYLEIGMAQGAAVASLLKAATFSDIQIIRDLAGRDRIVKGSMHAGGTSERGAAPL
ncbi:peptide chain release factor N(5)-glutamine methyltransferase [Stomatobaculum longum]|uniref:peptide chain release factor N(5)-glutamine methyltransferase n=1 Tax=Stomatobaculum longum TaxID=796942 RepID=UPI0028ED2FFC|nr:peptide chain release factor N(5)-glutamine methyltransferase [Stomatobaculum longum]